MMRSPRTYLTLTGWALMALWGPPSLPAMPPQAAVEEATVEEAAVEDDFFALDAVIEADQKQTAEDARKVAREKAAKGKAAKEQADQGAAAKAKAAKVGAAKEVRKAKPAAKGQAAVAKPKAKRAGALQAIFNVFQARPAVAAAPARALVDSSNVDTVDANTDEELDDVEKKLRPQGRAMLPQLRPQFDSICREELRFVHTVCNLKRSEFDAIARVARRTCRKALLQTVKVQVRMQQGWNGRNPPIYPNTQGMMEAALLKAVDDELSEARAASYRQEVLARQAFRREAGVESIVASLDRQLVMSPNQRADVLEPISEAWEDDWQRNVEMLVNGNNYMPRLPNEQIRKALSPEQRTVFSSIPQNATFFSGQPFGMAWVRGKPKAKKLEDELQFAAEEDP